MLTLKDIGNGKCLQCNVKQRYLGAVIEGVLQNTSGRYSAGSLHAVTHGSCVGEVRELLADIHELSELRLSLVRILVACDSN